VELDQVTLPARDIAESAAFYRAMGFVQIVDSPHYARFECAGGATFSIHLTGPDARADGVVVYFESDRLDARVAELQAAGFDFDGPPRDESWLWREARLRDPSGNVLCLYHAGIHRRHPPWRVAPAAVPRPAPPESGGDSR
jgi:catechol 2,3-dioxygenase-like lactoylglutathione lyase family enzyme